MFKKYGFSLIPYSKRLLSSQKPATSNWEKQEKILMEPFEYIFKIPCKHLGLLGQAFNHWLRVPGEKLREIEKANHTLSTWAILLDDIQDNSAYRYGVPSAHRVFGIPLTINAANKALFLGQKQISELGHPLAMEIFLKLIPKYFHGQGIDIYWRDNYIIPTEEAFIDMTTNKSASFAFPVELMQLFSNNKMDLIQLATKLGIFYHIVDDYYNLFQPKELQKMGTVKQDNYVPCSDITECKITLTIIHAMQFPDVSSELDDILKQRTSDPKLQSRVISLLKKHGSDEYTRNTLRKLEEDIRTETKQLGGNPILTRLMDDLKFQ